MRSILYGLCALAAIAPSLAQQPKPEDPIYAIGKGTKPPEPVSTPAPDFSTEAKRRKFDGFAVVGGYVGTDGKFYDLKIVRSIGNSGLDRKVLDAVSKWTFHPCIRDDKPVNCKMNIQVKIHLD
jgi:TonB family protein